MRMKYATIMLLLTPFVQANDAQAHDFGISFAGPRGGQFSFWNSQTSGFRTPSYRFHSPPIARQSNPYCLPRQSFSGFYNFQSRGYSSTRIRSRSFQRVNSSYRSNSSFWGF
mgnify:CR=1 FL=1